LINSWGTDFDDIEHSTFSVMAKLIVGMFFRHTNKDFLVIILSFETVYTTYKKENKFIANRDHSYKKERNKDDHLQII